jgi:hypothetical protein
MIHLRALLFFALCGVAIGAESPARIANISEVLLLPSQDSVVIRLSDEHGSEWRLLLAKGVAGDWSVRFGPIPLHSEEMAPVVEQSGAYREHLLRILAEYCDHAEGSGTVSHHLFSALAGLAHEILKAPNQAAEPTRTAVTPPADAGDRASGARGSP